MEWLRGATGPQEARLGSVGVGPPHNAEAADAQRMKLLPQSRSVTARQNGICSTLNPLLLTSLEQAATSTTSSAFGRFRLSGRLEAAYRTHPATHPAGSHRDSAHAQGSPLGLAPQGSPCVMQAQGTSRGSSKGREGGVILLSPQRGARRG